MLGKHGFQRRCASGASRISLCVPAGLNACALGPTDLDGNPRIVSGTVDIGAYEFQPSTGVRYVNADNPSLASPYTTWATAARIIQDAVDAAAPGDEIVVTNGTYATAFNYCCTTPLPASVPWQEQPSVGSITNAPPPA